MRKYIHIQDIRSCACYANVNARLLYLHIACQVDVSTYTVAKSLRQLGRELDIPLGAVRHALQQLVDAGLVSTHTATHTAAHNGTQLTTQLTTHLHIVRINEMDAPSDAPSDTPSDTASDTAGDTQNNNNNNKNYFEGLTLEHARERVRELAAIAATELSVTDAVASEQASSFLDRMQLKGKTWTDEGDLKAHFLSWIEKRLSRIEAEERRKPRGLAGDQAARVEERQRAAAEVAARSEEESVRLEIEKLLGWKRDAVSRGRAEYAEQLEGEISRLRNKLNKITTK